VTDSTIPGVRYLRVARHVDARGSFREIWRASAFAEVERALAYVDPAPSRDQDDAGQPVRFVQANFSNSERGVLRGLHYHQRQLDYWTVSAGRAFVALLDIRPLLSGGGARPLVETRVLAIDDAVVIPAGVGHGFLALERLELLYMVTNEYDGTDELGFAWNDPALGVAWPRVEGVASERPILSERDLNNPTLAELMISLRLP
jgi:dTDP-4-dehydrorhamnose 3,5-epimerase